MISVPLFLVAALAMFASATVQGATGFGFVIVAAPVLTSFMAPTLAVPVLVVEGFVMSAILMSRVYRDARPKRVALMSLFGVAFIPLGTLLLVTLDENVIKVVLGLVVGVTAVAMLGGFQRTAGNEQVASVPVGMASGLLMGSTGLAGAPVILFFANQGLDPRQFRANITAYLLVVGLFALPSFLVGGVLTRDVLVLAAALTPGAVGGLFTGIWLSSRISTVLFRRLALMVVLVAAGGAVVSGVTGFWF
ncbi:MAG: sulfite exporter TauE/SafE family protein [Chloroflexi bacterium]|nr:sulfite exporter TauE/SafE family protein [Chloroflexota bacterium]